MISSASRTVGFKPLPGHAIIGRHDERTVRVVPHGFDQAQLPLAGPRLFQQRAKLGNQHPQRREHRVHFRESKVPWFVGSRVHDHDASFIDAARTLRWTPGGPPGSGLNNSNVIHDEVLSIRTIETSDTGPGDIRPLTGRMAPRKMDDGLRSVGVVRARPSATCGVTAYNLSERGFCCV